jgi:hypothetical protein
MSELRWPEAPGTTCRAFSAHASVEGGVEAGPGVPVAADCVWHAAAETPIIPIKSSSRYAREPPLSRRTRASAQRFQVRLQGRRWVVEKYHQSPSCRVGLWPTGELSQRRIRIACFATDRIMAPLVSPLVPPNRGPGFTIADAPYKGRAGERTYSAPNAAIGKKPSPNPEGRSARLELPTRR